MAALDLLRPMSLELTDVDIGTHIDRVDINSITPLQFAIQYVAKNKPVILTGAINQWPALERWTSEYLSHAASGLQVTVDLTPNGRGDSVTKVTQKHSNEHDSDGNTTPGCLANERRAGKEGTFESCSWFITPCEVKMEVQDFFNLLRQSRDSMGVTRVVPYVQHQNGSLTEEWNFLTQDIQPGLTWADQVFGSTPEATNIWIGDERSVTCFHKDHYENLYAVVRGTKVFHLLPPGDMYRMNLRRYSAAHYVMQQAKCNETQQLQGDNCDSNVEQPTALSGQGLGLSNGHVKHDAISNARPALHGHDESNVDNGQLLRGESTTCFKVYAKDSACDSFESHTESTNEESRHTAINLLLGSTQLAPIMNDPAQHVIWSDVEVPVCQQDTTGAAHLNPQELPMNLVQDPSLPAPLVAEVGPGEVLYLPAMWYHQVSQRCSEADKGHDYVIAVNYWYDMAFDSRWSYYKLVEALAIQAGLADSMES